MCSKCLTNASSNKLNAEAISTLAGAAFTLDSVQAYAQKELVLQQIDKLLGAQTKTTGEVDPAGKNDGVAASAEPEKSERPWNIGPDGTLYMNGEAIAKVVHVKLPL